VTQGMGLRAIEKVRFAGSKTRGLMLENRRLPLDIRECEVPESSE
jgi:hypothetical protein